MSTAFLAALAVALIGLRIYLAALDSAADAIQERIRRRYR